jgi:hypothetical protein
MLRGINGLSVPSLSYTLAQSGKTSLPVDPSALIYSHFEHVSGIPAQNGLQGVSISKLNLLDVLIGRLSQAPVHNKPVNPFEGIDSAIESYRELLRQATSAKAAMPYAPSPNTQAGALFTLLS